jgi:hypothetical protein
MFDLHYSITGVTTLSQAGVNYLASHDGDYHKAIDNGLHVSFEDRATLEKLEEAPRSFLDNVKQFFAEQRVPGPWNPIDVPVSGYNENLEDTLPINSDPRDCESDDNPDERLCEEYSNSDQTQGE